MSRLIVADFYYGAANFIESELAVLDKEQILQILNLEKTSITISRKKGEKAYRIPTEGGRESGIKVKYSRFEENSIFEIFCRKKLFFVE